MKYTAAAIGIGLALASPAQAEVDRGGSVSEYAQRIMAWHGRKALDGWYYSAATMWLGNFGACIASRDTILIFHPATNEYVGRSAVTRDSPWSFIVPSATYRQVISLTPWGARVYAAANAQGCFTSPAPCNFSAADLVALGVPVCR